MPKFSAIEVGERPQYLSDNFLHRVKRSYRLATEKVSDDEGIVWPQIDLMRRSVHDALVASENTGLRDIFSDPITTDLFYGVDNLASTMEGIFVATPGADVGLPKQARDQMVELAQALGVIRWVPREAEQFEAYLKTPYFEPIPATDDLLEMIEQKLGLPILFPNPFRGERGVGTSRGLASTRAIAALYQAFQSRSGSQTYQARFSTRNRPRHGQNRLLRGQGRNPPIHYDRYSDGRRGSSLLPRSRAWPRHPLDAWRRRAASSARQAAPKHRTPPLRREVRSGSQRQFPHRNGRGWSVSVRVMDRRARRYVLIHKPGGEGRDNSCTCKGRSRGSGLSSISLFDEAGLRRRDIPNVGSAYRTGKAAAGNILFA